MKEKSDNRLYGTRTLIEAIESGRTIDKVLFRKGLNNELFRNLFALVRQNDIPFQYVPIEKLNKITSRNHQGVIAFVSEIEYQDIASIIPRLFEQGKTPFILVLDGVTDVRNFGSIARTAECAGVDAIIVPAKKAAQVNADAMKTSAGALNRIPVCRVKSLQDTIKFLKNSGLEILAASEKGSEVYFETNLQNPLALIMGAEFKGVSKELMELCDKNVNIPLKGEIKSLNVAVSAGIICFEINRQRK